MIVIVFGADLHRPSKDNKNGRRPLTLYSNDCLIQLRAKLPVHLSLTH
jgi:hypothetical protein